MPGAAGHGLIRGERSLIWLPGYKTSLVGECEGTEWCLSGCAGPGQVGRGIVFLPISGQDFQGLDLPWPHSCSRSASYSHPSRLPGPKPVTGVGLGPGYSSEGFFIPWVLSTRDSLTPPPPVLWLFIVWPVCIFTWRFGTLWLCSLGNNLQHGRKKPWVYNLQLPSCFLSLLLYG